MVTKSKIYQETTFKELDHGRRHGNRQTGLIDLIKAGSECLSRTRWYHITSLGVARIDSKFDITVDFFFVMILSLADLSISSTSIFLNLEAE